MPLTRALPLPAPCPQALPEGDWFCSAGCQAIRTGLVVMVAAGEVPIGNMGHTWQVGRWAGLVAGRCRPRPPGAAAPAAAQPTPCT
jgi:hypothetical protein